LLADKKFRPSHYSIRLKKPEMPQRLGTAFGFIKGYGQIAARCSKRQCTIQMFQDCCRRATGGGRTATSP
jgi:hypothetical protein